MAKHPKKPSALEPEISGLDHPQEGFLSRWSRRKRDTSGAPKGSNGTVANVSDAVDMPDPGEAIQAREDLTDDDMPPLESLDENSDYSGFFSPKVSAGVKRAALRKLFRSAMFNITDGLDDYDEDFRNFEALGDIITADMRQQMEREAEKAKDKLAQEVESETSVVAQSDSSPPPPNSDDPEEEIPSPPPHSTNESAAGAQENVGTSEGSKERYVQGNEPQSS
jgi:hypothetical protein